MDKVTTVAYFPHQAHCYAFGGFEIQMLDAAEASRRAGVNVIQQNWWERSREAPIVHHWGMGYPHIDNLRWAKASGQKIVMTVLTSYYSTAVSRLWGYASALLAEGRISREALRLADYVVVVNELQAKVLVDFYGIEAKCVAIIPNIVPDYFFENISQPSLAKESTYWLIAGNICHRKNQIGAAEAAIKAQIPLVVVGAAIPGEEGYSNRLKALISSSKWVVWKPEMRRDSLEYRRLLQDACGLLLPSRKEQQPIIALEMAALGKPIILGNRDYGRQAIFGGACLVDTESSDAIACALRRVTANYELGRLKSAIHTARSTAVGEAYRQLYQSCLYNR
jgi:glycosyltransferase involved in cell wall biosynthesis